uniref:RNA-directed RNA polymerase n=1 Tax=Steinernema glaseri TaxID=37863 RepID=A0A1I7Y4Q1_9BILA
MIRKLNWAPQEHDLWEVQHEKEAVLSHLPSSPSSSVDVQYMLLLTQYYRSLDYMHYMATLWWQVENAGRSDRLPRPVSPFGCTQGGHKETTQWWTLNVPICLLRFQFVESRDSDFSSPLASDPRSMDSVPITFCRDVCASLGYDSDKCCNLAASLTGLWKTALSQYAANAQHVSLRIGCDDVGWWYYAPGKPYVEQLLPPFEEFLLLSRRYFILRGVVVKRKPDYTATYYRCSREDMVKRLAPFITAHARPFTYLDIRHKCPEELVLTAYEMFRTSYTFGELVLSYHGPKSEEFLFGHVKNNVGMRRFCQSNPWPHTEALEEHVMELLHSKSFRSLELASYYMKQFALPQYRDRDFSVSLRATFAMFKAIFDAWVHSENKNGIGMTGVTGLTLQDVLSMPVPANVTRTDGSTKADWDDCEDIDRWKVCWTKQDGSCMNFDLEYELYITYTTEENGVAPSE